MQIETKRSLLSYLSITLLNECIYQHQWHFNACFGSQKKYYGKCFGSYVTLACVLAPKRTT